MLLHSQSDDVLQKDFSIETEQLMGYPACPCDGVDCHVMMLTAM